MLRFPRYIVLAAVLIASAAFMRVTEVPAAGGEASARFRIDPPPRREVVSRLSGVIASLRGVPAAAAGAAGYLRGEDPSRAQRARPLSHPPQPSR